MTGCSHAARISARNSGEIATTVTVSGPARAASSRKKTIRASPTRPASVSRAAYSLAPTARCWRHDEQRCFGRGPHSASDRVQQLGPRVLVPSGDVIDGVVVGVSDHRPRRLLEW
jgi:hypothetical protein